MTRFRCDQVTHQAYFPLYPLLPHQWTEKTSCWLLYFSQLRPISMTTSDGLSQLAQNPAYGASNVLEWIKIDKFNDYLIYKRRQARRQTSTWLLRRRSPPNRSPPCPCAGAARPPLKVTVNYLNSIRGLSDPEDIANWNNFCSTNENKKLRAFLRDFGNNPPVTRILLKARMWLRTKELKSTFSRLSPSERHVFLTPKRPPLLLLLARHAFLSTVTIKIESGWHGMSLKPRNSQKKELGRVPCHSTASRIGSSTSIPKLVGTRPDDSDDEETQFQVEPDVPSSPAGPLMSSSLFSSPGPMLHPLDETDIEYGSGSYDGSFGVDLPMNDLGGSPLWTITDEVLDAAFAAAAFNSNNLEPMAAANTGFDQELQAILDAVQFSAPADDWPTLPPALPLSPPPESASSRADSPVPTPVAPEPAPAPRKRQREEVDLRNVLDQPRARKVRKREWLSAPQLSMRRSVSNLGRLRRCDAITEIANVGEVRFISADLGTCSAQLTENFDKRTGIFVKIELFCTFSTRFGVTNSWDSSTNTPVTRDTAPLFAIDNPCRIDIQLVGHGIGPAQNPHEQAVVHVTFAVPPPGPLQEYLASMHGKAWQSPKPPQFTTQVQKGGGNINVKEYRLYQERSCELNSVPVSSRTPGAQLNVESRGLVPESILVTTFARPAFKNKYSRNLSGTLSDIRERIPDLDARILALERALAASRLVRQNPQTRLDVCKYPILTPPDNTTHPVKLDGTYGPNVPSNLTGMRKFPYHGYTTRIMAVSLYRAYHGTPQTCGGDREGAGGAPMVAVVPRIPWVVIRLYMPRRNTMHTPSWWAVHTLHTAGQERGGAWRAKYHAYHDTFPDVIVKLPCHQLPWVGTIGAAPLPPSETLKKYHAYLMRTHLQQKPKPKFVSYGIPRTCPTYIPPLDNMYKAQVTVYYIYHGCWGVHGRYRRTWGVEIPHVPQ
ncbi:hypothetical protein C8J57DRAFT_1255696 [Mycena rebaudengoi]|nr:hypothetical protein C8J57DRAFT_1255696 [Mycena rebaudengoi]